MLRHGLVLQPSLVAPLSPPVATQGLTPEAIRLKNRYPDLWRGAEELRALFKPAKQFSRTLQELKGVAGVVETHGKLKSAKSIVQKVLRHENDGYGPANVRGAMATSIAPRSQLRQLRQPCFLPCRADRGRQWAAGKSTIEPNHT